MSLIDSLGARIARTQFTSAEKARAEAIFEALLPADSAGLPAPSSLDRVELWRCIETAPGPSFGPGLRAMIHAFTYLPLADRRFRKPFHALDHEERERFVAELGRDERYPIRQMVTTLKMIACFGYFDDASVRARFDANAGGRR